MKFAVVPFFFATLALASPAPMAQPKAAAAPMSVVQPAVKPVTIETRADVAAALEVRAAEPGVASAAGLRLESRVPTNKVKVQVGNGTSIDTGAAGMVAPSRVLVGGVIGLEIMEFVRMW